MNALDPIELACYAAYIYYNKIKIEAEASKRRNTMRKQRLSQSMPPETDGEQSESQNEPSQLSNTVSQRQADRKKHRQHLLRAGLAIIAGRTAGAISRRLHF